MTINNQTGIRRVDRLAYSLTSRVEIGDAAHAVVHQVEAETGGGGVVARDARCGARCTDERPARIKPAEHIVAELGVVGCDSESLSFLEFGADYRIGPERHTLRPDVRGCPRCPHSAGMPAPWKRPH